jgi:hypothetical protein
MFLITYLNGVSKSVFARAYLQRIYLLMMQYALPSCNLTGLGLFFNGELFVSAGELLTEYAFNLAKGFPISNALTSGFFKRESSESTIFYYKAFLLSSFIEGRYIFKILNV